MLRILIPTDFSVNALHAAKYALALFKEEACEFYLMHAYADEVYQLDPFMQQHKLQPVKQRVHKFANAELNKIAEGLSLPSAHHTLSKMARFGSLIDEADELANLKDIDLILMGTQGRSGDKKLSFGSNTLQVMKYVKCPVLAVPAAYHFKKPKNFLFVTDLLLPFKNRELELVCRFARNFRSKIQLLYVSGHQQLSLRQLENKTFFESVANGIEVELHNLKAGDLTETINDFLQQHPIDMLVMTNSRHSYLENILYTSSIEKIGLEIQIPFLVLQNLVRS